MKKNLLALVTLA